MTDIESLAWFTGLFEGEGCFVFNKDKPKRMAISLTDYDVLERIQLNFGGTVSPLKKRKEHWKDAWIWSIGGEDALKLAKDIHPFLLSRRSKRCEEFINNFVTREESKDIKKQKAIQNKKLAIELKNAGMTHKQISETLGVDRTYVTHLLGKRYMAY